MIVPYNKEYEKRIDIRFVEQGYVEMYEEYIPIKENLYGKKGALSDPVTRWVKAINNLPDNLRGAILNEVMNTGK